MKHGYIIVPGGPDTHGYNFAQDRIQKAIDCCKSTSLCKIIIAGKECEAMKRYAVDNGIPEADMLAIAPGSRSTLEDLYSSKKTAEKMGWKNPLIITSFSHKWRTKYFAGKVDESFEILTSQPASSADLINCMFVEASYLVAAKISLGPICRVDKRTVEAYERATQPFDRIFEKLRKLRIIRN